jgi:hypothetical protein
MMTPYGIWNLTLKKWVKNEDYTTDYWDYDYFKVKNTMEQIQLIEESAFKAGNKKNKSEFEVREKTTFI